jgi:integrase
MRTYHSSGPGRSRLREQTWSTRKKRKRRPITLPHVSVLDNEKAEPEIGANGDGLGWVSGWVRLRETRRKPINLRHFLASLGGYRFRLAGLEKDHAWRHRSDLLADQGADPRTMQDYLGHRDPKHTAHYTRVAGHRFVGLWR